MSSAASTATAFPQIKDEFALEIPQCIEKVLGKATSYNQKLASTWVDEVADAVCEKLESMNENFKYIVNASIVEKKGAGLHTAAATYWDGNSDDTITIRWENKSMFCIIHAFGLAM
eukprot:gnl/MRDRNA2_/MRDRNA2_88962_c0_seq1.p1 gnl/MRDRNA2_/MRDRNA2_88962_c0~~gnl/MRDRNA2_/MRDRNA2_88962_c0_seq1.p1  ORF type:complete len:116 (+),score=21.80 gnl/MRDRNA2_/MRDRNA2_88962_c0_seq1:98-445(+)